MSVVSCAFPFRCISVVCSLVPFEGLSVVCAPQDLVAASPELQKVLEHEKELVKEKSARTEELPGFQT